MTITNAWRVVAAVVLTMAALLLFVVPLDVLPDLEHDTFAPLDIDFVVHLAAMAVLVVVWSWALPSVPVVWVALVMLVLGAVAELSQALPVVERSPRWRDFGYNVVGVALGVVAAALVRRTPAPRIRG